MKHSEYDKSNFWADEELTQDERGYSLWHTVSGIVDAHRVRILTLTKAVSVYDNIKYDNLIDAAMQASASDWCQDDEITFNALRSVVATLSSKVTKNKILPRIVTTNARWSKREEAKRLDKFIRGLFYQLDVNRVMAGAGLDCILSGDGFVKVCNDGTDIWLERVLPDEVYVDFLDAMYDKPSCIYQTRVVNTRNLYAQYPDHADELYELYKSDVSVLQISGIVDQSKITMHNAVVIEAWALPVGSLPGRHMITVGSYVILDEEWDKNYFPFIHMQYSKPERGYYTKGLYQETAPIQREITKVSQRISDTQRLMNAPKIFHLKNAMQPDAYFTNEIGTFIPVTSMSDFEAWVPPPLSGESFNYLASLKSSYYEQSGVSQLSSASKLPAGIDGASGKALREYNDIETERFALLAQEWENAHQRLAEILIKEVSENRDFFVKSFDRNNPLEKIYFSDLGIDIDNITIDIFPVSSLPSRPEAKFQAVQEYIQAGFIDERDAMELLDMPDLDAYSEVKNAPKRAADRIINSILDENVYMAPDPMMDLEYIKIQATLYYNRIFAAYPIDDRGEFDDDTNVKLDLLRQLMEDVATLLEQSQAPVEQAPTGLPEGISVQPGADVLAMAAAGGEALPPGMAGGSLPPEAMSLLGG